MVRPIVTRRVRSHNKRRRSPVPVRAAFVPVEGVGERRRGAFEEKPRGTRFLRTRRTVRGTSSRYFCADRPAGLGRRQIRVELPPHRPGDAPSKSGNVARKATAPTTVCRRPDTPTGGTGRAHDPRTCMCVCVCVCEHCARVLYSSDEPSS